MGVKYNKNDLIRREDARRIIDSPRSKEQMLIMLEDTPAANVEERKKGKWIIDSINEYELSYGTMAYEPVYKCSNCGRVTESYIRLDEPIMPEDADFPNFCPWCGARMEE